MFGLSEKFDYYGVRNIDCDESVDSQAEWEMDICGMV